jgi:AraC-like DNA-binding protein/ligand-binding sensor protein
LAKSELQRAVEAFEGVSGLRVCANFASGFFPPRWPHPLEWTHRSHTSRFCQIVKANTKMKHCGGHDSVRLAARVGRLKRPLVNICHAGIAEVAVPVFVTGRHVATFFCGQARTERVASAGFEGVRRRVTPLEVDVAALEPVFERLPLVPEKRMEHAGAVLSAVAHYHVEELERRLRDKRESLSGQPRVEQAVAFAREHCCEDFREADVARACGISPSHLSRTFRKIMGITFTQYLTELRMNEAQRLLVRTSMSVMEVAMSVGYSRHSYFSKRFRQTVGVTPIDFRRRVLRERHSYT